MFIETDIIVLKRDIPDHKLKAGELKGRDMMETDMDKEFLAMIQVIYQGPNSRTLRKFVEFLYEQEDEVLTDEDWAAIQEGREDVAQSRVITLEEYEKARGW